LTPDWLATPLTYSRRGQTATLPPWAVLRHIVNHTTYHRGQVASKLKRFGGLGSGKITAGQRHLMAETDQGPHLRFLTFHAADAPEAVMKDRPRARRRC